MALRESLVLLAVTSLAHGFNKAGNCQCGKRIIDRIAGGTIAAVDEWPWQAAVVSYGSMFCGGSLINDRYVLTAAHCVKGKTTAGLSVWLSDHKLSVDTDTPKVVRSVQKIIMHGSYRPGSEINDIALLKLASPITVTADVLPVCLPPAGPLYSRKQATVTGWGTTSTGGSTSDILRELFIPVVSHAACQTAYGISVIKPTMLCAGSAGKDSCQGDSGGPLVLKDGGGRYDLIGVVSWGRGCGIAGYPGVYTRVNKYLTWIDSNTKDGIYCKGF